LNRDFHELYVQVTTQRPELRIAIGLRAPPPLLKEGHRSAPTPLERLRTLFQRRPHLDLTSFFYSIAADGDEITTSRITDHTKLKQAIQEVNYRLFILLLSNNYDDLFIIETRCSIF
jgi:hypothetical protein